MQIAELTKVALYIQQAKPAKSTRAPARGAEKNKDTVELSSSPADGNALARKLALRSIKDKIAAGYYSSNEVAEDLSEKLTQVFKETV
jgi:hypothetical protein